MHTVELLDETLELAGRLGYKLRQDWLDGKGGGACYLKGQKLIFVDLAQTPDEQLAQLAGILHHEPGLSAQPMSSSLRRMLTVRKAA